MIDQFDNTPEFADNPDKLPAELEAWIGEQTEDEAAMLKEVWTLAGHAQAYDLPVEPDAQRFTQLTTAVKAATGASSNSTVVFLTGHLRLVHTNVLKMAAVILVLVLAGGAFLMRPVVYQAPAGAQVQIALADGSQVTLNSGSRLVHRRLFDWRHRDVELQGEGFFDVAHGAMPFTVKTFNGQVTVLGTRFNVRAWEGDTDPETEVVLEEGSVRFTTHSAGSTPVILKPGERSIVRGTAEMPSAPEQVNPAQQLAWRRGGFLFVNRPVGAVLNEVARRFAVEIDAPASLRQETVSLRLNETRDAEEVLQTIAATRGYTLEKSGNQYKLTTSGRE